MRAHDGSPGAALGAGATGHVRNPHRCTARSRSHAGWCGYGTRPVWGNRYRSGLSGRLAREDVVADDAYYEADPTNNEPSAMASRRRSRIMFASAATAIAITMIVPALIAAPLFRRVSGLHDSRSNSRHRMLRPAPHVCSPQASAQARPEPLFPHCQDMDREPNHRSSGHHAGPDLERGGPRQLDDLHPDD